MSSIKFSGVFLILFIVAATPIFMNMINEDIEVPVIPQREEKITININQPKLDFSVNINASLTVNILYYIASSNSTEVIVSDLNFNNSYTVDNLKTGLYQISIKSTELAVVTLRNYGFSVVQIVLFFMLMIINIYSLYVYLDE